MPRVKKQYLVIACTNCARLLLAASDKRTRTCPYCGKRIRAEDAHVAARSEDPRVARQFLQEAKTGSRSMISAKSKDSR